MPFSTSKNQILRQQDFADQCDFGERTMLYRVAKNKVHIHKAVRTVGVFF